MRKFVSKFLRVQVKGQGAFLRVPLLPIPENTFFNIYLHIYTNNHRIGLHDHPWNNISIKLWGTFSEAIVRDFKSLNRGPLIDISHKHIIFRKATTAHTMQCTKPIGLSIFVRFGEYNDITKPKRKPLYKLALGWLHAN